MNARRISMMAVLLLGLAGCSSGSNSGGDPPPPPPPSITTAEAFQFLNQATFGATRAEADRLIAMNYEAWIDDQLGKRASLQIPHVTSLPIPEFIGELQQDRVDIWFRNALQGRGPAAPASGIRVVGDHGRVAARNALIDFPYCGRRATTTY